MVNADHMRLYPPDPYANSWLLWLFVQCAFLMSMIQTSKLKAYFLGAPKPLLYLSGAGGQKLGTRKVQEECLGHFWFIQGGSPEKSKPKQFQHLGLTLVTLVLFRSPVKLEGKKWMTRLPQNSGFGINEETLIGPIKACFVHPRKVWQKKRKEMWRAIGDYGKPFVFIHHTKGEWRQECWEWRYEKCW